MRQNESHQGGCHCGKVRFKAAADLQEVISCNCSICTKHGLLLAFVPAERFEVLAGEDNLVEYRFNKGQVQHLFCRDCGVECFGRGKGADGAEMVAVNVRCVDDIDLSRPKLVAFDGKSL